MIGNSHDTAEPPPTVAFEDKSEPAPTRDSIEKAWLAAQKVEDRREAERHDFETRLAAIEENLPQITDLISGLTQHANAIGELQRVVSGLMQQRDMMQLQVERHTRATALDLAIKAAPAGDAAKITDLADAFVGWLTATPPPAQKPAEQQQVQ